MPTVDLTGIGDGRYELADSSLCIELRVGGGELSFDVFRTLEAGGQATRHLLASSLPHSGDAAYIVRDTQGRETTVDIARMSDANQRQFLVLTFDGALQGLPVKQPVRFGPIPAAKKVGASVRALGVDVWHAATLAKPAAALAKLVVPNVDVVISQPKPALPAAPGIDWDPTTLAIAMSDVNQLQGLTTGGVQPGARVQLFVLPPGKLAGLRGLSVDFSRTLPRVGAAVFVDGGDDTARVAQRVVHQLGHALNLVHPWERELGRGASKSLMNNLGPGFDPIETAFLLHGTRADVVPGGAPFHSAEYWIGSPRDGASFVVDSAQAGFELALKAPAAGPTLAFGQPAYLTVELRNRLKADAYVPEWLLDLKVGALEVFMRRLPGGSAYPAPARRFIPLARRCYDETASSRLTLKPGESHQDNVNANFGTGGFSFAEPGAYEVTALLTLRGVRAGAQRYDDVVIRSTPLVLRVAEPASAAEEREGADLLSDDVGLYWALGGFPFTPMSLLFEIAQRRYRDAGGVCDGVVAAILRAHALEAHRTHVRLDLEHKKWIVRQGDPVRAARFLRTFGTAALGYFDASTAARTKVVGQGQPPGGPGKAKPNPSKWTVLIYMAAEAPDLSDPAAHALEEIAGAVHSDDVQVLVQIDDRNQRGTQRFVKRPSGLERRESPGETDTGDPAALAQFVHWGLELAPAARTALVFWGHSHFVGLGARPEASRFDPAFGSWGFDSTSRDALSVREMRAGLASALRGTKLDLVGFVACYVAAVEHAYELREVAVRMLASQQATPFAGWNFRTVLTQLAKKPTQSPLAWGRQIVRQVGQVDDLPGLTLLNLNKAGEVAAYIRAHVESVRNAPDKQAALNRVFAVANALEVPQFVDLADAYATASGTPGVDHPSARALTNLLMPKPGNFVEAHEHIPTSGRKLGGVSIYYPRARPALLNAVLGANDYRALSFCIDTRWAEFAFEASGLRAKTAAHAAAGTPSPEVLQQLLGEIRDVKALLGATRGVFDGKVEPRFLEVINRTLDGKPMSGFLELANSLDGKPMSGFLELLADFTTRPR